MSPAARRLLLAGAARRRRFSTDAAASDSSRPSQQLPKGKRWDAVVIGGGHNGLVAAAYLARAGRSVAVLERRGVLGGAAVSESDLVPGFRFSRCSYLLSLLRPAILRWVTSPKDTSFAITTPRFLLHSCAAALHLDAFYQCRLFSSVHNSELHTDVLICIWWWWVDDTTAVVAGACIYTISDLELERHGLKLLPRSPSSFTPCLDGRYLLLGPDAELNCSEISKFSRKDAEAYPRCSLSWNDLRLNKCLSSWFVWYLCTW